MPPWAQMVPMVLGIAVLVVSVFADALPGWVGVVGAVLVIGGIVLMMRMPRRLLARTNRAVHVFALPRSQKGEFERPLTSVALDRAARRRRRRRRARRRAPLAELRKRDRARRPHRRPRAPLIGHWRGSCSHGLQNPCHLAEAGAATPTATSVGVRSHTYRPPCGQVVSRRPGSSLPLLQPGDRALLGSRRRDVTPDPTSAASPPRSPPRRAAIGEPPERLRGD